MGPVATGRLIEALRSQDESAAHRAAQALERYDTPEVVKALVGVVARESTDRTVKSDAIITLGRLEANEAVDVLLRELEREDTEQFYRENVAVSLSLIGDARALPALEAFKEKNYPQGRRIVSRRSQTRGTSIRLEPVDANRFQQIIKGIEKMKP